MEVADALEKELGHITNDKEWREVFIFPILAHIVARVSGRIFVGPKLKGDEGYLQAAVMYTKELMDAKRAIDKVRPWLRPFVARRLPEVRRLWERVKQVQGFLRPEVERRLKMDDEGGERPDDFLQWMIDEMRRGGRWKRYEGEEMARLVLGVIFASIHTVGLKTSFLYVFLCHLFSFS